MLTELLASISPSWPQRLIADRLATVDIELNGHRPWDIRVHDPHLYRRLLVGGSLALGESYVEGAWDCSQLDLFFMRLLRGKLDERCWSPVTWWFDRVARWHNRQSPTRALEVAQRHYDLHPDLYHAMLGEKRVYSCGYWREAGTLDEAQLAKIDLVCRKLGLQPGMRVLDIGCGWGAAARHAAEQYGAIVVGITISHEQAVVARQRCHGLPVTILEQDYRTLEGSFERIFSIGMFEHVGAENYRNYFSVVRRCLTADGLFLLHTIGSEQSAHTIDPWLDRYIFPNATIPSVCALTTAYADHFILEDWHNFGADYDRTLMAWHARLEQAWDDLRVRRDERVRRLWRYYLLSCAASFRVRKNHLWQVVFSPTSRHCRYHSIR